MRKFILTSAIFLCSILIALGLPMNCECWSYPTHTSQGVVTVNWTYTGGGSNCYNSYQTGNMYPWSTAYVYLDGVLVDVITFSNSNYVSCQYPYV